MAGSVAAVAAVGVAVAALRRRLRVVTVIGMSMAPTYAPGERVLVRRVPARALRRGQVVVFEEPDGAGDGTGGWPRSPAGPDAAEDRLAAPSDGQAAGPPGWMIKRVAAVPGDPVPRTLASVLGEASDAVVPANRFAVLGDNPSGSFDSRKFGYVPGDRVLGVAVRRLHIRRPAPHGAAEPGSRARPGSGAPDPVVGPGLIQPSRAAAGSGPDPTSVVEGDD